ncbi:hypothetical protein ON010_g5408 [Phytophthora cinnamomi]|nr:hypothetical protein ON010_g5408 [Phytophthora cinnamomi]
MGACDLDLDPHGLPLTPHTSDSLDPPASPDPLDLASRVSLPRYCDSVRIHLLPIAPNHPFPGIRFSTLVYRRSENAAPVRVYTNADWANNEEDRKSVSGVLVQVFGCPVSWQTKRQRIVSKSSTIAEYIAADDGVEEAHWVLLLLQRLSKTTIEVPIPAMIDNKSTIKRLVNGKNSEAQKTVDCRFFSIRDAVASGLLRLVYCPTTIMLADGLTKAWALLVSANYAKRSQVLAYMKGSSSYGLVLPKKIAKEDLSIVGYADADPGNDPDTRRPISGQVVKLGGCVIAYQMYKVIDYVNAGYMQIKHLSSADMPADALTKALGKSKFRKHRKQLGVECLCTEESEVGQLD